MTKAHKFLHLPFRKKWLLFESVIGLTVIKILSIVLPFRYLAMLFGKQGVRCSGDKVPPPTVLTEISWAIRTAERVIPWGKKCLVKALTAKLMARFRGFRTTFYLGVGRNEEKELIYHAWLQYQDFTLTGGKTDGAYKMLDSFY